MTTRELAATGFALACALAFAGGCYDSSEPPQAGGHTNWLQCEVLADCPAGSGAVECRGGYCLDRSGERIDEAARPPAQTAGRGAPPGDDPSDEPNVDHPGDDDPSDGDPPLEDPGAAAIPSDWREVESVCGYRFRAPPDVREEMVQGEDSCMDRHWTADCRYDGGYGAYQLSFEGFTEYPEFETVTSSSDGMDVIFIAARLPEDEDGLPFFAAIEFAADANAAYLSMTARCSTRAGQDEARRVLASIIHPR